MFKLENLQKQLNDICISKIFNTEVPFGDLMYSTCTMFSDFKNISYQTPLSLASTLR